MCEIPNNVILAEEFAELFDGFSIGSNDLTQLTLGVDRDSELLAHLFDEQDPGVKRSIATVIERAHRQGRKVGLCGQAPSDHPEFADFLADVGIDSISVTATPCRWWCGACDGCRTGGTPRGTTSRRPAPMSCSCRSNIFSGASRLEPE